MDPADLPDGAIKVRGTLVRSLDCALIRDQLAVAGVAVTAIEVAEFGQWRDAFTLGTADVAVDVDAVELEDGADE